MPGPVPPIPSAGAAPPREALDPQLTSSMGVSDRTGSFALSGLRAGTAQVVVDHPAFQQTRSGWIQVGGAVAALRLVLRAGAVIAGRVLDERG